MKDHINNSTKATIKGSGSDNSVRSSTRMTRFSIQDDDMGGGPSSPTRTPAPKKRKTVSSCSPPESAEDEEIESEYVVEVEDDEGEEMVSENQHVSGKQDRVAKRPIGNGLISVTLTDPDVLDCPICFDSLSIPVFQCENGHIACASCCTKIGNKCPSCAMPIGYNRCRAIEKVLESLKVSCRNIKYGCEESLIYSKKNEHEATCFYTPCYCPVNSCYFCGSSKQVYTHFAAAEHTAKHIDFNLTKHISLKKNQGCLYLQEKTEGIIFVVNQENGHLGSAVNIVCIAPVSSKRRFRYHLIARNSENSITLQSVAENTPDRFLCTPMKAFLVVPSDLIDSSGQIKLEVCIKAS